MSFRVVTTPLRAAPALPSGRPDGFREDGRAAFLTAGADDSGLARLAEPGAVAVTTGQQPALFTGPLYTIHKALSAAALARLLERRWSRPVVPVFWIAGDDHDFSEANHASWLGADGEVCDASLRTRRADEPMLPLYREPLGVEVEAAIDRLQSSLPASDFREGTLGWIRRHYQPEATVSASFGGALAELLSPFGIVCLDSTHRSFKTAAAPLLLDALRQAAAIEADLVTASAGLTAQGRDPGIPVGDGATLVMLEASAGRDRLVRDGDAFLTRRSGERFTLIELERIAAVAPERLSPNVLLRPVIESALLPTVAYVAGPGELRYLPLAEPLYRRLGIFRQLPVPRWSGQILDSGVERTLAKFGISAVGLEKPLSELESTIVRGRLPAEAETDLAALRGMVGAQYAHLQALAGRIDPTLGRSVEGRGNRALKDLERIERRFVAHLKRRMELELGQLGRARAAVYPRGVPQERIFSIVSPLARYGPAVLDAISAAADAWYAAALETTSSPT